MLRAPACTSWDTLVPSSCYRTEIPPCLHHCQSYPFPNSISSMYNPFQWPQCPQVSVTASAERHFLWNGFNTNIFKQDGEPLKTLCACLRRCTLVLAQQQPRTSGHSSSNTAPAKNGGSAKPPDHHQDPMVHQLYFATSGSPVFLILSNSCFCVLKSSSHFFTFVFLMQPDVDYRCLGKTWRKQAVFPTIAMKTDSSFIKS